MLSHAVVSGKLVLALRGDFTDAQVATQVKRLSADEGIAGSTNDAAKRIAANPAYANPARAIADDILNQVAPIG